MKYIWGILVLSVIVIIHELGHFLLAKKNGIEVVEFSIGLGPTLFGFKCAGTKFSVKLLPFGGACQMLGEDFDTDNPSENAFNSKGVWARISVILAGPVFNFILAFVLSVVLIGVNGYDAPVVTSVSEGSPADAAGLKAGDIITKLDGSKVDIAREITIYFSIDNTDGKPFTVEYERDGKKNTTEIVPEEVMKYMLGLRYYENSDACEVAYVVEESAFDKAGIIEGDILVMVGDKEIATGEDMTAAVSNLTGEPLKIRYIRNNVEYETVVTPEYGSAGYKIGFGYNGSYEKTSPLNVIKYSFVEVKYSIKNTVKSLKMLFTGKVESKDIGGPVAIVNLLGNAVEEGEAAGGVLYAVLNLISLSIFLTANLGVMNLLPIPALDGGKFVFLIIEAIKGKPLNREKEGIVNMIGFIALMLLMVLIFVNDIKNFFF